MEAIVLALFLQIALESLPVSSSGNILAFKSFFLIKFSEKAFEALDHFAHGPTLFIIIIFFRSEWGSLFSRLLQFQFHRSSYKRLVSLFFKIVSLVCIVDLITALFYWILKILRAQTVWFSSEIVLFTGLGITIVGLFSLRWLPNESLHGKLLPIESWDLRKAIILGFVQGIALLPGISRFASIYVVGRWLRLSSRRAFQISFLVHVPLITAAFLRATGSFLLSSNHEIIALKSTIFSWSGGLILLVATLVGYGALYLAQRWAFERKFWRFGIYVILLLGVLVGQYFYINR